MKLRNKETGEIGVIAKTKTDDEIEIITNTKLYLYKSISEVCQHWEDYEEPREYWYICEQAEPIKIRNNPNDIPNFVGRCLSIGNLFETKEEAEKAVRKLKAWKRLKDKKFKFRKWRTADIGGDKYYFVIQGEADDADKADLDLLFGGEE